MSQRKRYCNIKLCPNENGTSNKDIAMFRISPPGNAKRDDWISAIETYQEFQHHSTYFSICELHFPPSSITKKNDKYILSKDVVPTIFPMHPGYVCLRMSTHQV